MRPVLVPLPPASGRPSPSLPLPSDTSEAAAGGESRRPSTPPPLPPARVDLLPGTGRRDAGFCREPYATAVIGAMPRTSPKETATAEQSPATASVAPERTAPRGTSATKTRTAA